jgi:hypothetical protein
MLVRLDRPLRVAYILGEIFGVSSTDGAWICGTTEAAYRKRLSRARDAIREFIARYCALVAPARARCHSRKRVPAAIDLGRIDPRIADEPSPAVVDAAVAEMEALYDAAELLRSVNDRTAPEAVTVRIRSLVRSGRHRLVGP